MQGCLDFTETLINQKTFSSSVVFYCIDGMVIVAQCTATFLKIYCAPPNLGITRT